MRRAPRRAPPLGSAVVAFSACHRLCSCVRISTTAATRRISARNSSAAALGGDPGHKGHARGILAQPPRRGRIGARALPTGAGEVLAHPRIEHHHLDARRALCSASARSQAVDAGGFEHHARRPTALREPAAHRAMPRCRVGHAPHRHRLLRRRALHIHPARTHIHSHHPPRCPSSPSPPPPCARVVLRSPDPAHIAHRPCVCRLSGLGYSTALAIKGGGPLFRTSSLAYGAARPPRKTTRLRSPLIACPSTYKGRAIPVTGVRPHPRLATAPC